MPRELKQEDFFSIQPEDYQGVEELFDAKQGDIEPPDEIKLCLPCLEAHLINSNGCMNCGDEERYLVYMMNYNKSGY